MAKRIIIVWLLVSLCVKTSLGEANQPAVVWNKLTDNIPKGMYTLFDDEHRKTIGKWTRPAIVPSRFRYMPPISKWLPANSKKIRGKPCICLRPR